VAKNICTKQTTKIDQKIGTEKNQKLPPKESSVRESNGFETGSGIQMVTQNYLPPE
jgi:hypothetical protein